MPREKPETVKEVSSGGVVQSPARPSILVVDDEENFRTLLRWFLSQRGYDVVTASSTAEALGSLTSLSFSVALLDIRLGSDDGLTLLEQLRQRSPDVKVVMMTAYPTATAIRQSYRHGASKFLTKPVDLADLLRTIQGLC